MLPRSSRRSRSAPTASRDVDRGGVRRAEPSIALAGFVSAHARRSSHLGHGPHEALVVACADESDEILAFISRRRRAPPRSARSWSSTRARRTGSSARRSTPARPIWSTAPRRRATTADSGATSRSRSRRPSPAARRRVHGARPSRADGARARSSRSSGPKGGTGKTLTSCNLAGALAQRGPARHPRRPRPAVRRRRAGARAARPDQTIYDLATVGRDARRREGRATSWPRTTRACGRCSRRDGPTMPARSRVEFVRELFDTLRADGRLRRRRHPAGLHARGDRRDRQVLGRLRRRDARRAVAQEHASSRSRRSSSWSTTRGEHQGRPQPRGQPRRRDGRRRRAAARPRARRARPEPPRHHALGQRGGADRAARRANAEARKAFEALGRAYVTTQRAPSARRPPRHQAPAQPVPAPHEEGGLTWNSTSGCAPQGPASDTRSRSVRRAVKNRVHQCVITELGPQLYQQDMDPAALRTPRVAAIRAELATEQGLSRDDRERLVEEIADDTLGHGPLEKLLADPTSPRSWSTARRGLDRARAAGSS